jgi:hypothetical protein
MVDCEKEYEAQLERLTKEADHWEAEHKKFLIKRVLFEAAIEHDAFMPNQVVAIVSQWAFVCGERDGRGELTGNLKVWVDFPDKCVGSNKDIICQYNASDAVGRLKQLQPNLFN